MFMHLYHAARLPGLVCAVQWGWQAGRVKHVQVRKVTEKTSPQTCGRLLTARQHLIADSSAAAAAAAAPGYTVEKLHSKMIHYCVCRSSCV